MLEHEVYERYLSGYSSTLTEQEIQALLQKASASEKYQIDRALQPHYGKGADHLSINNPHRANLDFFSWPDLLSIDVAFWQQQHWLFSSPAYAHRLHHNTGLHYSVPDHYVNLYCGETIQLIYHSQFVYARLFSALHYILIHAKLLADHWSLERFPHHLPTELYHPHEVINDKSFDPNKVVNNQSYQALKQHFLEHYTSWVDEQYLNWIQPLDTTLNKQTAAAYIIEYQDADGLPWVDFICKNNNALQIVRPDHFVEDIENIAASHHYLEHEVQQIAAQFEKHYQSQDW
ncbi:hypothetical protein [Vibrio hangzhouensis]|uniref:Uncharacterized protein n=1 Tax=Vibrio hangzhouensis TaxID=462991 RepID=A0A1H5VBN8_9VIBR|nr:hypothetical protein [Vibrio hangzhouensis]SEF84191.1 hypothetical protein SAMN04488244_104121 [Vibrio hangzhouensis]